MSEGSEAFIPTGYYQASELEKDWKRVNTVCKKKSKGVTNLSKTVQKQSLGKEIAYM